MCDKLVFDLAQEVEGSPNVFIRKDWLNILDNQNQNYNNNQSVLDTSQLSNSNKYMSYREAYFLMPMLLTLVQTNTPGDANHAFTPASSPADNAIGLKNWFGQIIHSFTLDYNGTTIVQQTPYVNMWNAFKLMTSLSYGDILTQGATIGFYPDDPTSWTWTPAPPSVGVGGSVATYGTAGIFNVDVTATANGYVPDNLGFGQGVSNNTDALSSVVIKNVASQFSQFNSGAGNKGHVHRHTYICYDAIAPASASVAVSYPTQYSQILTASNASQLWKSYIMTKIDGTAGGVKGVLQISVMATIYLKHIHSFFNMCPLLKGVFMKMTMNLNNTSTSFEVGYTPSTDTAAHALVSSPYISCTAVSNPLGGINPGMISAVGKSKLYNTVDIADTTSTIVAPAVAGNTWGGTVGIAGGIPIPGGGAAFGTNAIPPVYTATSGAVVGAVETATNVALNLTNAAIGLSSAVAGNNMPNGGLNLLPSAGTANTCISYKYNISVGAKCLDSAISTVSGVASGSQAQSVYLYIPAYTFNPVFEQAYLSSPVKQIKYTDIYQYQVLNVAGKAGSTFNNLLTNGIANVKSVLIVPYFSGSTTNGSISGAYCGDGAATSIALSTNTGFLSGYPVFQSPFDPAGSGPTSPLALIKNFNVQISGQNAIYNLEKYAFEQFNNQLYGQNAVNGGLTDGITSGLVDRLGFDMEYCYYYVNVERMLPVEMSVPKSVQIIGTVCCEQNVDLYCFIEYGVDISIDALTGARV